MEGQFLHGFNADELTAEQAKLLVQSEYWRRTAMFVRFYNTEEKYEGYKARVKGNHEFQKDWNILKKNFRKRLTSGKKVLRSKNDAEYSSDPFQAVRSNPVFQDIFDSFCWKWFLDGMEGDEPIVAKLSFDVTPFGTTIFIPGYWSFDPKRDIKWNDVLAFHRSRGVKRQGEAFEPNRRDREIIDKVLLEAEAISRARGESGKAKIDRCIEMAHLARNTDPAYVYRRLREAKQNQRRRPA